MYEIGTNDEMEWLWFQDLVLFAEGFRGVEEEWRRYIGSLKGGNVGGNGGDERGLKLGWLPRGPREMLRMGPEEADGPIIRFEFDGVQNRSPRLG